MALLRRRPIINSADAAPPSTSSTIIESYLNSLHKIEMRPIALLTAEECSNLDNIRQYARELYGTPEYNVFHSHILEIFTVDIYPPHTVGSFFTGCVTPTNISSAVADVNPGCSLLCSSDSLPSPQSSWGFCSQNVIWCVLSSSSIAKNLAAANIAGRNNTGTYVHVDASSSSSGVSPQDLGSYDFIHLTRVPTSSKAILLVDFPSYDEFTGFTKREKARLIHRLHINNIKLLSYDKITATEYKDLIGKTVRVIDIKTRPDIRDSEIRPRITAATTVKNVITPSVLAPDDSLPMDLYQKASLGIMLSLFIALIFCTFMFFFSKRKR